MYADVSHNNDSPSTSEPLIARNVEKASKSAMSDQTSATIQPFDKAPKPFESDAASDLCLDLEMLRHQALAITGIIHRRVGQVTDLNGLEWHRFEKVRV